MLDSIINFQDVLDLFADLLKYCLPLAITLGLAKWFTFFVLDAIFDRHHKGGTY